MADGTLLEDSAGAVHHVMRGQSSGLVDNHNAVHAGMGG
jgi:hypothetical protein